MDGDDARSRYRRSKTNGMVLGVVKRGRARIPTVRVKVGAVHGKNGSLTRLLYLRRKTPQYHYRSNSSIASCQSSFMTCSVPEPARNCGRRHQRRSVTPSRVSRRMPLRKRSTGRCVSHRLESHSGGRVAGEEGVSSNEPDGANHSLDQSMSQPNSPAPSRTIATLERKRAPSKRYLGREEKRKRERVGRSGDAADGWRLRKLRDRARARARPMCSLRIYHVTGKGDVLRGRRCWGATNLWEADRW